MNTWIKSFRVLSAWAAPTAIDVSMAAARIISLSCCNLMLGLIVYFFEEEGDDRGKWIKS
ncbi:MAG: hypothetical protein ABSA46_05185 [Thermodesulfovibrionales bacterium]|jgi:hypothetical protein